MPRDLETICLKCLEKEPGTALRHRRGPGRRPAAVPRRRADHRPGRSAGWSGPASGCGRHPAAAAPLVGAPPPWLALVGFSAPAPRLRPATTGTRRAGPEGRRRPSAGPAPRRQRGSQTPSGWMAWSAAALVRPRPGRPTPAGLGPGVEPTRPPPGLGAGRVPRLDQASCFHDRGGAGTSPSARIDAAPDRPAPPRRSTLWDLDRRAADRRSTLRPTDGRLAPDGRSPTARPWRPAATTAPAPAPGRPPPGPRGRRWPHPGGRRGRRRSAPTGRAWPRPPHGVVRSWRGGQRTAPCRCRSSSREAYALRFGPDGYPAGGGARRWPGVAPGCGRRAADPGRPAARRPGVRHRHAPGGLGPEFTPDGRLLLTTARGRLDLTDAADGRSVRTINTGMTAHGVRFLVPSARLDGRCSSHSLSTAKVIRLADGPDRRRAGPDPRVESWLLGGGDRIGSSPASTNGLVPPSWQLPPPTAASRPQGPDRFARSARSTRLIFRRADRPRRGPPAPTAPSAPGRSTAEPPAAQPLDFSRRPRRPGPGCGAAPPASSASIPKTSGAAQSFSPDGSPGGPLRRGQRGAGSVSRAKHDDAGG